MFKMFFCNDNIKQHEKKLSCERKKTVKIFLKQMKCEHSLKNRMFEKSIMKLWI